MVDGGRMRGDRLGGVGLERCLPPREGWQAGRADRQARKTRGTQDRGVQAGNRMFHQPGALQIVRLPAHEGQLKDEVERGCGDRYRNEPSRRGSALPCCRIR
jgi:hypothetical protein